MTELLRLRDGVDPTRAISALRELAQDADNVPGSAGIEWYQLRDAYVHWVDKAEAHLASLSHDPDVVLALFNERHWQLRSQTARPSRPFPLIQGELDLQSQRLRRLADILDDAQQRLAGAAGSPTVLDTNVLLHFEPPKQIDWVTVLERKPVRLIIPLRVIEELDQKKWGENAKLRDRARSLLPQLESWLEPAGRPKRLCDEVTLEVPVPSEPRDHPADADSEILATAQQIQLFTGDVVTVVTGDTTMRIRAQALRLQVHRPPEKYLRDRSPDPPAASS